MSDLDGLNLVQLMERMHDIVEPDAVSLWPQTPGWTLVGGWLLAGLVFLAWRAWRKWRTNAYRREALRSLEEIRAQANRREDPALDIASLVRRTALSAYPRARVASLHGHAWAAFLAQSCGESGGPVDDFERIAQAAWRRQQPDQALFDAARTWIRGHHA